MATSKSKVDGIESHITQKYEIQKRLGKGVSTKLFRCKVLCTN